MTPEENAKWHNDRYEQWRVRAIRRLETLGPRVEALGHRFYAGCGFHYDMENKYKNLHVYLAEELVVTIKNPAYAISHQIVNEVILEELCKDVSEAEKSADELAEARINEI